MYARKFTAALLHAINARSFAETCNRPASAGGNSWACIIDRIESPDDQTLVFHLTPRADFATWTGGTPTVYDAATALVVDAPNVNDCLYHAVVVAADGRRKDWYDQYCAGKHDSLQP